MTSVDLNKDPFLVTKIIKWGLLTFFSFFLLIAFLGSFKVIEPGNVGVIFNQMSGSLKSVPQGLAWKIPFVTSVESYPVALRTYTMVAAANEGSSSGDDSVDLPTKEGQHIKQDLSVTYNTSEDKASYVFKSFRGAPIETIEQTFIRRTIITVAQNVAGQMSLTELISTQRDRLQEIIQKNLNIELGKMGFNLDKVNMGASHLPPAIEQQMQQKMASQQLAQAAEFELQKQQTLAKARVAEAEGQAKALLAIATAQSEANKKLQVTLNPLLVQSKWIDKWNGAQPLVSGGSNLVNLPQELFREKPAQLITPVPSNEIQEHYNQ